MALEKNGSRTVLASMTLIFLLLLPGCLSIKIMAQDQPNIDESNGKMPWWVDWSRDMNNNHIDDELEHIVDSTAPTKYLRVLVDYDRRPVKDDLGSLEAKGAIEVYTCKYIDTIIVRIEAQRIHDLVGLPDVAMLEADLKIEKTLDSAERSVKVDVIHDTWSIDGTGVVIGIVDTGIDAKHMGLDDLDDINSTNDPKVIAFYDAKNHPDVTDGSYPPYDDDGHGSHVSGIASGTGSGSDDYRYVGVAPGASLVGIKVLGPTDNSMSDAMQGLEWARANKDKYGIKVLSLSFGAIFSGGVTNDGTSAISRECDSLVDAGFVVVVAAGNSGPRHRTIAPPGDAREVITVGNVQDDHSLNPSSSRGPVGSLTSNYNKPDVCAPGTDVVSVKANTRNNYTTMTGTSMSTPFVSGVVALMFQLDGTLTPTEVKNILTSTAGGETTTPFEGSPNVDYGYGIIRPLDIITNMTFNKKPAKVDVDDIAPLVHGIIKLTGSTTNGEGQVQFVEVEDGSGDWDQVDGTVQWEYSWDTTGTSNGGVELRFRAYDGVQYSVMVRRYTAINNILINMTLPEHAVFSGNSTIQGTTYGLVVKRVDVNIDDGTWKPAKDISPKNDWSSWDYAFTTGDLKAGKHTFNIRAFDGYDFTLSPGHTFYIETQVQNKFKVTPSFEAPLLILGMALALIFRSRSLMPPGRWEWNRK